MAGYALLAFFAAVGAGFAIAWWGDRHARPAPPPGDSEADRRFVEGRRYQ